MNTNLDTFIKAKQMRKDNARILLKDEIYNLMNKYRDDKYFIMGIINGL